MWLLDTDTLKLCEFLDPPPYAILSHTWGPEEVSFHDLDKPTSKNLLGYKKIEQCCALARSQRLRYAWIDTCCINKTSSAELSEAINSMYAWYGRSSKCYAYLSDFSCSTDDHTSESCQKHSSAVCDRIHTRFWESRWFRRGWTLQELLAPFNVDFYDRNWQYVGDKLDLAQKISEATGIDEQFIIDCDSISRASVAARMSWASRRFTTRLEDQAYCLMGLFDVNMPLLYGEGCKAFLRLQHEITRSSDDESLFAWHPEELGPGGILETGIFADSPAFFAKSRYYIPIPSLHTDRTPYTITNQGLAIDADCIPTKMVPFWGAPEALTRDFILFPLNCVEKEVPKDLWQISGQRFTITLRRVSHNTFVRNITRDPPHVQKRAIPQHHLIYVGLIGALSTLFGIFFELLPQKTCPVTLCLSESGNTDSELYCRYSNLLSN